MKTKDAEPKVNLNLCYCGRIPVLRRWHDGARWIVICLKCTTNAKPYQYFDEAVKAWNSEYGK
jgi:hypothetical protein